MRRQKTYSGQSGYVYQYYYEGRRQARFGGDEGLEYVFSVSADRKTHFPVSVFLMEAAVAEWERRHDRPLHDNERYAVAKMALFQAFDERAGPAAMRPTEVRVRAADVALILETLSIE